MRVVKWFDRTPRDVTRSLLRPRRQVAEGDRVLLQDLHPDAEAFLGQSISLQLAVLQQAGAALAHSPSLEPKARLVEAVRVVSTRYRSLAEVAERHDIDAIEAMRPFVDSTERFARETAGADWYEQLLSLHVTMGLLTDFFVAYAGGLPDAVRHDVVRTLTAESGQPVLQQELRKVIDENPRLASRLAMWGRRLVGDTLLQMYLAVHGPDDGSVAPAERLEPAFNDIVAAHTRRMDLLGLTA